MTEIYSRHTFGEEYAPPFCGCRYTVPVRKRKRGGSHRMHEPRVAKTANGNDRIGRHDSHQATAVERAHGKPDCLIQCYRIKSDAEDICALTASHGLREGRKRYQRYIFLVAHRHGSLTVLADRKAVAHRARRHSAAFGKSASRIL